MSSKDINTFLEKGCPVVDVSTAAEITQGSTSPDLSLSASSTSNSLLSNNSSNSSNINTKKRNRATKVCDFCKRRKVKCDLGNPCSTCVKYGNKLCRYVEQGQFPQESNDNPRNIAYQSTNPQNRSTYANPGSTLLYNDQNGNGISQSAELQVQDQLFQLKEKLRSLEESVQARRVKVDFGDNHNSSSSTNNNSPPLNHNSHSALIQPGVGYANLVGLNPVGAESDTINFFEGYTSVLVKDDVRRRNYGPLSWIALIKVDSIGSKLWTYLHILKSGKALKTSYFRNLKPSVAERGFREKASIEEGYQDIKPYDATSEDAPPLSPSMCHATSEADMEHTKNHLKRDFDRSTIIPDTSPSTSIPTINNIRRTPMPPPTPQQYSSEQVKNYRQTLNEKAMSFGIAFYEGGLSEELAIAEKIELVLPKQKAIWLLYKRYFSHLYSAIPLIDEVVFKERVQKLIGIERTDGDENAKVKVKVNKKMDFATLGLLLIVLRLSYLTLFTNVASINEANIQSKDPSPRAQEVKYLLNNPVNIDCIDMAQTCLNQFNLTRSINMEIMQLAVYTRIYHCYAPEDGDGTDGGDALVFNAMLIQMAISLGLNRDPDNFHDQCNDEKINNLGRKIWYYILVFDVNNAMAVGTPLSIDNNSFDTKPPYYIPGNENIIDVDVEKSTVSNFAKFDNVFAPLSEVMKMITNVKEKVKLTDLMEKLDYMEKRFVHETESLTESLFSSINLSQVEINKQTIKMKIHFTSNFFMVSIFFHIFNYYERKGNYNLAYFYLKKIFVITIHDLMPFYFEFLDRSEAIFQNSTDLTITPAFESVTHKSTIVLFSVMTRIRIIIVDLEHHYEHQSKLNKDIKYKIYYELLKRVYSLIEKCVNVFRESIARLSHRYYYAWRITKAQNFLTMLLSSDDTIKQFKPAGSQNTIEFTSAMLEEIASILESALFRVKEHKKAQKSTTTANNFSFKPPTKSESIINGNVNTTTFGEQPPYGTTTTDSESRNSMDYSDSSKIRGPPSATSVGSTSSLDNIEEFMPSDKVDQIWLQMMSMKNFTDNTKNNPNQDFSQYNNNNNNFDNNYNSSNYYAGESNDSSKVNSTNSNYNNNNNDANGNLSNNTNTITGMPASAFDAFTPGYNNMSSLDGIFPSVEDFVFPGTNLPLEELFKSYD
ncbi:hypothetical protein DFJ63DRAFT_323151 [Scheffersomyces coipomensis]|uniref:uncharacterized protein n=1 Tax=Scheffersomyces coipomensis TaxID=1788519 RepID=UPI00315D717A